MTRFYLSAKEVELTFVYLLYGSGNDPDLGKTLAERSFFRIFPKLKSSGKRRRREIKKFDKGRSKVIRKVTSSTLLTAGKRIWKSE